MYINNQVILQGVLGKDPEKRERQKGEGIVAVFSLATKAKYKDEEITTWHNITAFKELAEKCVASLKKGDRVLVIGSNSTSSWEDKGVKKTHYFITASDIFKPLPKLAEKATQPKEDENYLEGIDDEIPF